MDIWTNAAENLVTMTLRPFLLMLLFWGMAFLPASGLAAALPSVALYYGDHPPLAELRAFDVAVVDPDHVSDPARFRHPASALFAYVSLGEVHPSRSWFKAIPDGVLAGSNRAWGSRLVDPANPAWQSFVLDQVFAPLWRQGYRGFFLDTLDSYHLLGGTPADLRRREAGLAQLVHALHSRWPEARLIMNRGFEILPEVHDDIWMVAAESLYHGWDNSARRFVDVPEKDRQWLKTQLDVARNTFGKPVLVIDYVPAANRELARETAARLSREGYVPWVSVPALDQLGVGNIEVLPRRVLVIYNPAESPDLHYADVQRFLGMPLARLGLTPDYVPVNGPLPDWPLVGRYAGIVSWINSDELPDAARYGDWLKRQTDNGVPLAVFGRFGVAYDSTLLQSLGLQTVEAAKAGDFRIVTQDPMMGFEMPVTPRAGEIPPLRLRGAAHPLLGIISSAGQLFHPAALTPWGGFVLAPYTVSSLPGQDNGERWHLNPLTFLQQALKLDSRVPVPDITTENGRRLLMVHIDGDGFASAAERPGAPASGEVLRDVILKKHSLPTTFSVIEGETGAAGLYPARSPSLEAVARDIFSLPWVEAASHSFSHPFNWGKAESNLDNGESYHLPIPGYEYRADREIAGSINYINRRLTPAAKPVKLFLWTGNCVSTPESLAETVRARVLNMNGGETTITRTQNSWTRIAGPGLPRGEGLYQVFAPNQNENVYTNLWTGPFYGYRRVIETFELTETPYRFKPVDIYYHVYAASKTASLNALESVYRWAESQPLHPVYASEYVRKVLDFNDFVVARTPEGYRLRGNGDLRTVRLPATAGLPDFGRSVNVAGTAPGPSARYVHLTTGDALLAMGGENTPLPYLEFANARITRLERLDTGLSLDIQGYAPLRLSFANAAQCRPLWNNQPLPFTRQGDRLTLETARHDLAALQILCPR
ncbi:hypothetical protein EV700_0598 [Fluviicoccus keumensis]|uniref:Glycoside-hydrolase family GH114 TIM-barrel domain-containing protein n=1 Tax=Fluviicoccus keumensis TaxID=1435465 RepID=A0A4Q7ZBX9_9GAMM|nr:bifunctional glycoside hydrolase 114/ polysaccharide deacetylase family protein [Fluviicoccus keumensis]RZU47631.1 hypothetical protein EV700_0598 [Fluviicoccus keumensis]